MTFPHGDPDNIMPTDMPNWSPLERQLFDDLGLQEEAYYDRQLHALYDSGYFMRGLRTEAYGAAELGRGIRGNLQALVMERYGIDFADRFDWKTWRDNYEGMV